MSCDGPTLIRAIEEVMFRIPQSARGVVPLSFQGIRGRRTALSSPFTNLVGVSSPESEVPDESIRAVIDEFQTHRLAFGWLVGPYSPQDLPARLEKWGMQRAEEFSGLTLTDLDTPLSVPKHVSIQEISREGREEFAHLLGRAFGLPTDIVSFLCDILYFAESELRARNYFAYLDGVPEPVAVASTLYDPNDPIVVLAGSAVLEEHRGQGVYSSLVCHRLEDVRREGIEAAVIQAVRSTSAPICRSLGFREVCSQLLYTWKPEGAGQAQTSQAVEAAFIALPSAAYFEPMGGAISRVDPKATAFPHRNAAYSFHILAGWSEADQDQTVSNWARSFYREMTLSAILRSSKK